MLILFFVCSNSGNCQNDQKHPELCRNPNGYFPIPPNVKAYLTLDGSASLGFKEDRKTTNTEWPSVVGKVYQVCTLKTDKVILFGQAIHFTHVVLLEEKTGKVLDQFYTYNLSMSPNQRWLAFYKWFPRMSDNPPSSEFLLYDLTKDAAANRPTGISLTDSENVGKTIYPAGFTNQSSDHLGLSADQIHEMRGSGFSWSPDSRFVAAGDSFHNELRVVLVNISQSEEPRTLISVIPKNQTCQVDGSGKIQTTGDPYLNGLELSSDGNGFPVVNATISDSYGVCKRKVLLNEGAFQLAPKEPPVREKRTQRKSIEVPF